MVQLKEEYLTLQADCNTLNGLNQALVKRLEGRKKATKKHFGEARVLTVAAIREQLRQRQAIENEAAKAKAFTGQPSGPLWALQRRSIRSSRH
jgi:hypothetical protein